MNKYNKIFLILLGGLLVAILFYLRVLRVRIPKDLRAYYMEDNLLKDNSIIMILSIIFISVTLIRLILLIKAKLLYNNSNQITVWIKTKLNVLFEYRLTSIYAFYVYITEYIYPKNSYYIFEKICFNLFFNFNNFNLYIIIFEIIPRLIIYLCFFIDILIFYKFDLFYKALFLFIIPIIFNIIIFLFNDFACSNVQNLETLVYKKSLKVGTPDEYHETYLVNPQHWLSKDPQAFLDTVEKYRNVLSFKEYFLRYSLTKKFIFEFWISLFINLSLLIGWSYVLILNIYMFFDSIILIKFIIDIGSYLSLLIFIYCIYYLLIKEFNIK
jgi:hypothetical protein